MRILPKQRVVVTGYGKATPLAQSAPGPFDEAVAGQPGATVVTIQSDGGAISA
jgi:hypothetical protein